MKIFLSVLPVAILVTYSQLIVKWRAGSANASDGGNILEQLLRILSDPVVFSAYVAALIASFAWLFVVRKLPLTTAFPVYIGVTFVMVLLGGRFFLGETLSIVKVVAVLLILFGIILGVSSNA